MAPPNSFFLLSVCLLVIQSVLSELLCRSCGHTIVVASSLRNVTSGEALQHYNVSILGKTTLVQMFRNPVPETFHVISAANADVNMHRESYGDNTWFPGYRWRVCVCSRCESHIGWQFESKNGKFYGLVLDYLISKDYADSLTIIPHL